MALKQTRRSVSLNHAVLLAVKEAAAADGVSMSEYVTRLIRAAIPGLAETIHASSTREAKAEAYRPHGALGGRPRLLAMTRADVERALAPRVHVAAATSKPPPRDGIPHGTLCANCVDLPATHMGRVDKTGRVYPLCRNCELPAGAGNERERRWQTRTR